MTAHDLLLILLGVFLGATGGAIAWRLRPKPYAALTEAQAVKLFSAAWAMGYALIPGMPVVEDVVHRCHTDIADVLLEVDFPDIGDAIIRQGERERAA